MTGRPQSLFSIPTSRSHTPWANPVPIALTVASLPANRMARNRTGFDGVVEVGNVFAVEAFVGRRDGGEGVKLEQQVVVTESGPEVLDGYPMDLV